MLNVTEDFRTYTEQIRLKTQELHQKLVVERDKNGLLDTENDRLTALLHAHEGQIQSLTAELNEVQQQLEEQREQSVPVVLEVSNDSAIDGLVKEIDFCIQQLKLAHE